MWPTQPLQVRHLPAAQPYFSVRSTAPVAGSSRSTPRPPLATARTPPSGEKAKVSRSEPSPIVTVRWRVHEGTAQNLTDTSVDTRVVPSGEKATACTSYLCCGEGCNSVATSLRSVTFQILTVLSSLPEASHSPFGEKATERMAAVFPPAVVTECAVMVGSSTSAFRSQKRSDVLAPTARSWASGETATHWNEEEGTRLLIRWPPPVSQRARSTPEISRPSAGRKERAQIVDGDPVSSLRSREPSRAIQRRMVWSSPPDAIRFPSGENATALTRAALSEKLRTSSPEATTNTATAPSSRPTASSFPEGENATLCTTSDRSGAGASTAPPRASITLSGLDWRQRARFTTQSTMVVTVIHLIDASFPPERKGLYQRKGLYPAPTR